MLLKDVLLAKARDTPLGPKSLSVDILEKAEHDIVRHVQTECFNEEYTALISGKSVKRSSPIYKLSPIVKYGMICVGGRLRYSTISPYSKHQIIIPKNHPISKLIIWDIHSVGHIGIEHVLANIRQKYWIIKVRPTIKSVLNQCLLCRRMFKRPSQQMMKGLPEDRLKTDEPPFTYTGTDCFGRLYTKRGRSTVKRYGCVFTCLVIRAVNIEMLHSLDTSSFINALQRFIARRGTPKVIRSDNATNYKSAENELQKSLGKIAEDHRMCKFLLRHKIQWIFNTPGASHHGGVWERQIRFIQRILLAVSKGDLFKMDDEQLETLLSLVESIINSRPITHNSDDIRDPEALTPNHLLLLRSGPDALGTFDQNDMYGRRWKQIQWLASVLWKRWLKEYIPNLQIRPKWAVKQPNFKVDDLVLLMDDNSPRSLWPMGRITEVILGRDNLVRTVKVKTRQSVLSRPITKIVPLENVK